MRGESLYLPSKHTHMTDELAATIFIVSIVLISAGIGFYLRGKGVTQKDFPTFMDI